MVSTFKNPFYLENWEIILRKHHLLAILFQNLNGRFAICIQFNVNITAGILRSKFSDGKIHFLNFPLHPYLVYADKEERIKGGGCLELRKFVEKELGLDPDSITGD